MDSLKLINTQKQADKLQKKTNRVRNYEGEIKRWVQTLQDKKYIISQIRNSINKNNWFSAQDILLQTNQYYWLTF